ncbi:hypothetical protein ACK8HJ_21370 [Vreelandella titanicae]|uniref:hypothetical protein n=1 Tax=Vreelandella titanicae TaxID=664683 RepID=UPI003987E565|tara:strand:+ start:3466 stop:4272 length:807 start_codon:yes stop_codon:yes gene_type:complete
MDYRGKSREHLKAASEQLDFGSDSDLKYAALELRMAMEALTYDRALAFKEEFPIEEYDTWQPKKVMAVLLEIDPLTDKDSTIAYGLEEKYEVPAKEMKSLGTETVLNMVVLKKHYDALGSFLHIQTIKKTKAGKTVNYERMRKRCDEIRAYLNKVLSSPVFNSTFGVFSSIECTECGKKIRKRIPRGEDTIHVECPDCDASYKVSGSGANQALWEPLQQEIECANSECTRKIAVWEKEIRLGGNWKCPVCKGKNTFVLGVAYEKSLNK